MVTRRKNHRSHRVTRSRSQASPLSVQSLQLGFEKLDNRIRTLIDKGRTDADIMGCIQKSWRDTFQTSLSDPAIRGMLMHYRGTHTGRRRTRKAGKRSQTGGMAPIDYVMGQGTTATVYGQFPVPLSNPVTMGSLDNTMLPESSIAKSCAPGYGIDTLASQRGGGVIQAVSMGHMPMSVPQNIAQTTVATLQGVNNTGPSSSPVAASVPLQMASPQPYDASAISEITSLSPVFQGF